MHILLTNDDGFDARGIRLLHDVFARHHRVAVAAPDSEKSGISHAFTYHRPLRYRPLDGDTGMKGYRIDGTPSDCVKLAVTHLFDTPIDVVVSGLNYGENSGLSSIYSGTVAAAREGAFWGLPSFAFSVSSGGEAFAPDYAERAHALFSGIIERHASAPHDADRVFYNINFPACPPGRCRGIKITRQSLAFFDDRFRRIELADNQDGYQIYGEKTRVEESVAYDSRALLDDYIAVTPCCYDTTAYRTIPRLRYLER